MEVTTQMIQKTNKCSVERRTCDNTNETNIGARKKEKVMN
jgi:hypothetical protein